jgi:hypothetical protein
MSEEYAGTNRELADALEGEKEEVSKIGFALGLLTNNSYAIGAMTYRINNWIDDACVRLRRSG